jgi:hypothetical protein
MEMRILEIVHLLSKKGVKGINKGGDCGLGDGQSKSYSSKEPFSTIKPLSKR